MKIIETGPREIVFVLWGHCQNLLDDPRNCKYFNPFVMFYDSITKQVRNSYEYSRDSAGYGLSRQYDTTNKLKNRSRIS